MTTSLSAPLVSRRGWDVTGDVAADPAIVVRPATLADARALADIERASPVVAGDVRVTVDRGDDYFAATRLMEDVDVVIAEVDGRPAAVHCAAFQHIRVHGELKRVCYVHHLRVAGRFQGRGLFGHLLQAAAPRYPADLDGSYAWVSRGNTRSRNLAPDIQPWSTDVSRRDMPTAALAGPSSGRPATPADAVDLVELLNLSHRGEEFYVPYTVESLTARMERSPDLYSWADVWIADGAVLGVWPAGRTIRFTIESSAGSTVQRQGVVLDHGVLPGAEEHLAALIRARCGALADEGLDTMSMFTSSASPGHRVLTRFPHDVSHFELIVTGLTEPPDLSARGLHVDPVYF